MKPNKCVGLRSRLTQPTKNGYSIDLDTYFISDLVTYQTDDFMSIIVMVY